jgi:hypothetical protein
MANQVQQATGGTTSATEATAALEKAATSGNILTAEISIDKSAGDTPAITPSAGWTQIKPVDSGHSGVTAGMAYRVADGSATDKCVWTWEESRPTAWRISEYTPDGKLVSVLADTDYVDVGEASRTEIPLGPLKAIADGFAVAMIARDTGAGFTWDGGLTEVADFAFESNAGLGVAHLLEVKSGAEVATAPKAASGDQMGGILVVFGFEVPSVNSPTHAPRQPSRGLFMGGRRRQ